MSMRMKINKCYLQAFNSQHRYLVLKGGAGSGKSIAAVQKILIRVRAKINKDNQ